MNSNASTSIRVRFAPSPTGFMHLGNVRTALLNYLFAEQKGGTFVLRIEDTDPDRNFDPNAQQIIQDLEWLNVTYNEGGAKGGPYSPYYQSQRNEIYQGQLDILKNTNHIYRCFCTPEELEKKRVRSIALKVAPRYDRTCLRLTQQEIQKKLEEKVLFIWRFKIPENYTVTVRDLAHDTIMFDLNNFSDFPLTRSDGTFTFLFANCVDDMLMKISHVLRGEDHLSNTANQIILYETFGHTAPIFWHLPIICNIDGKKLSKRDFGFSLNDLKENGFLPEAITNYLAIIGGSFEQEIMDLQELSHAMHFDAIKPVSNIKYDVEKLRWVNHKWIQKYDIQKLYALLKPLLTQAYPIITHFSDAKIIEILTVIKSEMVTLKDAIPLMRFYFEEPMVAQETIDEHIPNHLQIPLKELFLKHMVLLSNPEAFLQALKEGAALHTINTKLLFTILRLLLMGIVHGPSIKDIISLLGPNETKKRIEKYCK